MAMGNEGGCCPFRRRGIFTADCLAKARLSCAGLLLGGAPKNQVGLVLPMTFCSNMIHSLIMVSESEVTPVVPRSIEKDLQLASSPPTARPIQKLSKDVINRIAAGEVIQRPANAVKELLENCLDAGSTQIQITVRAGGLKLLQVQDNGCGIQVSDLPILCERFTTSKLHEFSDLSTLSTFGFRGEALASLSHVSLLSVTSRTSDQKCAYRMSYRNGNPSGKAAACAGNKGTTVLAEDLFYNAPVRRTAVRSPREEFARVADVVAQYAVHYAPKCGFHLRALNTGSNSTGSDLRTTAGWSRMDAVRAVIGSSVAQNLVAFDSCQTGSADSTRLAVERLGLRYEGLLTTPSQVTSGTAPTLRLSLFINNRMVECTSIKRALESSYSTVLSRTLSSSPGAQSILRRSSGPTSTAFKPGGSHCSLFVYLNLQLPPESLDVNVHPTKAQVNFLNEEQIVNGLQDAVERCLLSSAQVRSFLTRPLQLSEVSNNRPSDTSVNEGCESNKSFKPQEKVRIDVKEQCLEKFGLVSKHSPQMGLTNCEGRISQPMNDLVQRKSCPPSPGSPDIEEDGEQPNSENVINHASTTEEFLSTDTKQATNVVSPLTSRPLLKAETPKRSLPDTSLEPLQSSTSVTFPPPPAKRRIVRLNSVLQMRERIAANADEQAKRLLRSSKFVGLIDETRCLIQHSTDLLLARLVPLSTALFYQLMVFNFANHGEMILSEPAPVKELLIMSQSFGPTSFKSEDPSAFVQNAIQTLQSNSAMLWDYFSMKFEPGATNGDLMLVSLPLLLQKYIPDLTRLPVYVMRLATEVNWNEEINCFEDVCRITAEFYAPVPKLSSLSTSKKQAEGISEIDGDVKDTSSYSSSGQTPEVPVRWMIEHVLWPALSSSLIPGHGLLYEAPPLSQLSSQPQPASSPCAFFRLTRLSDLYKVFERC
ncbi:hypothetical protein CRM22_007947 [Opisthorchis felineus]|uniref:DNA mismatch repair protein S5 domain-containing protein n=1 Tax=Opisthorchis felineus TaxID=147828 RepID=A0A4S2LLW7_OPIFE|nr:hypothetical protein CRM22_007947 [Opisthorchis felineus]